MHKLTCRGCGVVFELGRKKAYCSIACSKLNRGASVKRISPIPRACAVCAKVFTPGGGNWQARFCTAKCRNSTANRIGRDHKCEYCGCTFQLYRNAKVQKHCSKSCVSLAANARKKQNRSAQTCKSCAADLDRRGMYCRKCHDQRIEAARKGKCRICDQQYFRAAKYDRCCSDECKDAAAERAEKLKKARNKKRRTKVRGKDRDRARHAGVAYEPVNRLFVFARDKWRCQLCGCSTPKSLKGKNQPRSPELDHIVPLAMGGPHTYANVQCACRECNQEKGGYRAMGQVPLLSGGGILNLFSKTQRYAHPAPLTPPQNEPIAMARPL